MKNKLLPVVLFLILILPTNCRKEEIVDDPNSLIGMWKVDTISYCFKSKNPNSTIAPLYGLPDTCSICFQPDSTGYFSSSIKIITGPVTDFIWHHNHDSGVIDFWFDNGSSVGVLQTYPGDTIGLFLRDYLKAPSEVFSNFFYLHMIKIK